MSGLLDALRQQISADSLYGTALKLFGAYRVTGICDPFIRGPLAGDDSVQQAVQTSLMVVDAAREVAASPLYVPETVAYVLKQAAFTAYHLPIAAWRIGEGIVSDSSWKDMALVALYLPLAAWRAGKWLVTGSHWEGSGLAGYFHSFADFPRVLHNFQHDDAWLQAATGDNAALAAGVANVVIGLGAFYLADRHRRKRESMVMDVGIDDTAASRRPLPPLERIVQESAREVR